MSLGISISATTNKSQRLQAKNWIARIWRIQKRSGDARYAAFEKPAHYPTCSARATSSRHRFFPTTDQLQSFRHMLTDVRTYRLETKAKMRAEQDPAKQHHLQALQNTFKILLNSFYGYLGFAQGHFADFDAAARVTQIGRDLLKKMIEWLKARGAEVIEVNTDGIYFVPPTNIDIEILQRDLANEL